MSQVWTAELRTEEGKGASRRLRHAGKIPAIIYGAGKDAKSVSLSSNAVEHTLQDNDMYNTVLTIKGAGDEESCVIKDLQRHPATGMISHIDFQRASDASYIVKRVPLDFQGRASSPGVKMGGLMSFMQQTVEVRCLAKDLPTKITVDVSKMEGGTSLRLSQLEMPAGVVLTALTHGSADYDQAVVGIGKIRR
ncbi:50S ribosomal protein L25/general stress protein Ctc [Hydrogenovibrio marinus]|uniref:Large ribosomal subunit protein bL25 n=1 Tax=Hydrogenovibrio marinus TaxID=28885 RepID=A0A066ZQG1_HYDMR|nr:50S ribosomal protein L25/general stress protein Ctc [Hydrogenovibrio marinus]KDN95707.1 50S ribosomal protein L25 [Hydrogenovibrio marinus]BBN58812.1 50S ribosomal protein L25 [Hydrogenovibrio marinus]